jgi:hypothetical protein
MMYDFRDLRFFQEDGTELDFWNESKTDGSSAVFWSKVERASQNKIIAFYGNPEAVSRSNGDKTFEFFDHFLGSSIDAAKWSEVGSGAVTVANSIMDIKGQTIDTVYRLVSNRDFSTNVILEAYLKPYNYGNAACIEQIALRDNSTYYGQFCAYADSGGQQGKYENYNGTMAASAMSGWDAAYHIQSLKRNGSSAVNMCDRANSVTVSNYYYDTTGRICLSVMKSATKTGEMGCDWVLVRKYTATEPTVQILNYGNRNPEYR